MANATDRTCSRCNIVKPVFEFKPVKASTKNWQGLSAWCRQCFKSYMDEYRKRPDVKAANRARVKEYIRTEHGRQRRADYIKKYAQSEDGIETITAYRKQYFQRPDVKARSLQRTCNRRKYLASGSLTGEEIKAVIAVWGNRCAYCACLGGPRFALDHVLAISLGGAHDRHNVVPACQSCNSRKKDKPLEVALMRMGIDLAAWSQRWAEMRKQVEEFLAPSKTKEVL